MKLNEWMTPDTRTRDKLPTIWPGVTLALGGATQPHPRPLRGVRVDPRHPFVTLGHDRVRDLWWR
jgi:hypothetical protein